MNSPVPSLDRPSVSRPAAALAGPLGAACDLSAYRLAGGTALAWDFGHRRSDDLDFFTRIPEHLDRNQQERFANAFRSLDADAHVDISQPETIHATVRGCKVSLFGLGGRWLGEPVRVLEGLAVATVDEIGAMKLIAVSTRSAKKDFFDLHALASRGYSAERLFSALRSMHPGEIDLEVADHVVRALTDFSDAELDPDPGILDDATWAAVKRSAEQLAADLRRHVVQLGRSGVM